MENSCIQKNLAVWRKEGSLPALLFLTKSKRLQASHIHSVPCPYCSIAFQLSQDLVATATMYLYFCSFHDAVIQVERTALPSFPRRNSQLCYLWNTPVLSSFLFNREAIPFHSIMHTSGHISLVQLSSYVHRPYLQFVQTLKTELK